MHLFSPHGGGGFYGYRIWGTTRFVDPGVVAWREPWAVMRLISKVVTEGLDSGWRGKMVDRSYL